MHTPSPVLKGGTPCAGVAILKGGKKNFPQNPLFLHRWYRRFESFISIGAAFTPIPRFLILLFKNNEPAARVLERCQCGVNELSLMEKIRVLKLTKTHFFPPFWMTTDLALLTVVPYVSGPSSASVALSDSVELVSSSKSIRWPSPAFSNVSAGVARATGPVSGSGSSSLGVNEAKSNPKPFMVHSCGTCKQATTLLLWTQSQLSDLDYHLRSSEFYTIPGLFHSSPEE